MDRGAGGDVQRKQNSNCSPFETEMGFFNVTVLDRRDRGAAVQRPEEKPLTLGSFCFVGLFFVEPPAQNR